MRRLSPPHSNFSIFNVELLLVGDAQEEEATTWVNWPCELGREWLDIGQVVDPTIDRQRVAILVACIDVVDIGLVEEPIRAVNVGIAVQTQHIFDFINRLLALIIGLEAN